jgi:uncharacterized protein YdeI (YjbR/CyaY-like superfamily)
MKSSRAVFFTRPAEWRRWLDQHHDSSAELWVGFYKTSSGRPSITWPQAVDEALCFGWIDGLRRGIDGSRYQIRFTPRKASSVWSKGNLARVAELRAAGRLTAAGRSAFEARRQVKSGVYSYEQADRRLPRAYEKMLRANDRAREFLERAPRSYRKAAIWWVMSAKHEETRQRRLERLLGDSARGLTVPPLTSPAKRPAQAGTTARASRAMSEPG